MSKARVIFNENEPRPFQALFQTLSLHREVYVRLFLHHDSY